MRRGEGKAKTEIGEKRGGPLSWKQLFHRTRWKKKSLAWWERTEGERPTNFPGKHRNPSSSKEEGRPVRKRSDKEKEKKREGDPQDNRSIQRRSCNKKKKGNQSPVKRAGKGRQENTNTTCSMKLSQGGREGKRSSRALLWL